MDGASIPQGLWSLVGGPFEGAHRVPALLHDQGYRDKKYPREVVDGMFYEAMRFYGVNPIKARVMWAAVRTFGRWAWK
jgi:hypothetical protein